ncbi:MAG: arylsulfatase [Planctomycetia bacterium]|nr:arylsulfatase [Planctomycetia bacterium]
MGNFSVEKGSDREIFTESVSESEKTESGNLDSDREKDSRPNVIFILADDLGYGDLSCYGQKHFQTPEIDSLAAEGMKFTQFYAGSTVCAPSRCSLMTGFHTGRCYVRGNKWDAKNESDLPLPEETLTVGKVFQNAGYKTGMFGKWGLGKPGGAGDPENLGFHEFFGYYSQRDAHNYYPPFLYDGKTKIELDGKTYSHDLIEQRALAFIRANKERPFFCYMPVTIPHAAMQVPEEYMKSWREKFSEYEHVKNKYSNAEEVKNPVAAFPAMMTRLDETVGKVVNLLEELGIRENTIIIFSSDNGTHAEGGHRPNFFQSAGELRGIKRDLTEGGVRIPMIVCWPRRVKASEVNPHIAAFWDFLPTVCEIVGEKVPENIDGLSFLPTLTGNDPKQKTHEYLYWEFYEGGGKQAARWNHLKGIRLNVFKNPEGPIQVYDISKDIHEDKNIAEEHPEFVEKFEQIFKEAHIPSAEFKLRKK